MPVDSFSPFAPARVRALVLPLGRIKRSSFVASHALLTRASEVYLADLCSHERATKSLLSPEAFPVGVIFYDFNTSAPQPSHANLTPFELFREPTVILGIGDSSEYVADSPDNPYAAHDVRKSEFLTLANDLKDGHSRALVHRVLLFNEPEVEHTTNVQDELFLLPPGATDDDIRRAVWDITASLLVELASYATSVQALPSISSPTVPQHQLMPVQWPEEDRAQSPVLGRKELHRMSMPVFSNHSDLALRKAPARTFDEMASNEAAPSAVDRFRSRPESVASSREGSQERVSVHGFGSDSFSEKTRNKGRGRVGVVLASVYIQAGRWPDALRESIESAQRSRSFNDFIWHAKALENIALCMVLIAWSGMEFQIPQICYPFTEMTSTKPPGADSEVFGTELSIKPFASAAAKDTQLKMLSSLFPVLADMILSIFSRASSGASAEPVPHVVYSECAIRLARLLAAVNVAGGTLTENCLSHLILGAPLEPSSDLSLPRTRIHPSKREITSILIRAFPGQTDPPTLSFIDSTMILAGIASVFSSLGMQRKKALVVKELLVALIPGLVQARMIGAAEAGVHPLSGLAAIAQASVDQETESGLEDLINGVCRIYGIPEASWIRSIGSDLNQTNGSTHLSKELIGSYVLRSFGSPGNKANFLRTCIRLCEALPDYRGVLYYSSALLRTAGPGVAPSADTSALVGLSREEQLQIANDMSKTISVAKSVGLGTLEAEYWDEFLVRGLYILDPAGGQALHHHRKSDLGRGKAETQQGPFIHNPFGETKDAGKWPNLLTSGEVREFVVALQNPYDFEVVIERLSLQGDGASLDISKGDLTLKPYRTQSFSVAGTVGTHGAISVRGCFVKVRGCRERTFSVFGDVWSPYGDLKIKNIGLPKQDKRRSGEFIVGSEFLDHSLPSPSVLDLSVIPEQPLLTVEKSSVVQNALMLMEGESGTVSLTVHNASQVSADFIHVSVFDSTTAAMKEALAQKRISPSEMYEIEYHMTQLPAVSVEDTPTSIAPGTRETFQFHVLGKPGLSSITFQIDYANVSAPHLSNDDGFFTRQISYSISVTVNASIQVPRIEVLPLSNDLVWPIDLGHTDKPTPSTHCLALIDLRNIWPSPLNTTISVLSDPPTNDPAHTSTHTSTHTVQQGQTARHLLLLPRIHIPRPYAPIPTSRARQFVRSTARHDPAAERAAREAFWLRRELLARLRAEWVVAPAGGATSEVGAVAPRPQQQQQQQGARRGRIDLGPAAAARLPRASAAALRLPDLELALELPSPAGDDDAPSAVGGARRLPVDALVPVALRLRNCSPRIVTAPLVARLRAGAPGRGGEAARHVASGGAAMVILGALGPGEERCVRDVLQVCFVEEGVAEVCGWVEEVGVVKAAEKREGEAEEEREERWLGGLEGRRRWVVEPVKLEGVLEDSE